MWTQSGLRVGELAELEVRFPAFEKHFDLPAKCRRLPRSCWALSCSALVVGQQNGPVQEFEITFCQPQARDLDWHFYERAADAEPLMVLGANAKPLSALGGVLERQSKSSTLSCRLG